MTETNSEFTISRAYEDHRDLLTRIKTEIPDGGGGTNVVSQYVYAYDSIGLRSSVVNSGTAFGTNAEHNIWGYNDRGELTSSFRYVGADPSTTTNEVTAERRLYVYDPIGNRQSAYVGSSITPNPAYTANNLNQYTSTANPSESFDYDEDGNMTEDGTFEYTWNGENRLIQVEPKTAPSGDLRLTFSYDFMGRRVQKVEEEYDGSSWSTNAVTKFVWDGWLLIAELDGMDSDALTRTHTWGLDLSGTFTGAGGIGGLLVVDDDAGDGFCGYYAYDGNGNVGQVLDAEDLSTDAHYEYDPYGREIVSSGTYADANPWRFSTKYLDVLDPNDDDASLLYYGYRYLSPRLGRWLSKDPLGDFANGLAARLALKSNAMADLAPCAFGGNSPASSIDPLGLTTEYQGKHYKYIPDIKCHGNPHLDVRNKHGESVGKIKPNGEHLPHCNRPPVRVPRKDRPAYEKAMTKLHSLMAGTFITFCLCPPVELACPDLDRPKPRLAPTCTQVKPAVWICRCPKGYVYWGGSWGDGGVFRQKRRPSPGKVCLDRQSVT